VTLTASVVPSVIASLALEVLVVGGASVVPGSPVVGAVVVAVTVVVLVPATVVSVPADTVPPSSPQAVNKSASEAQDINPDRRCIGDAYHGAAVDAERDEEVDAGRRAGPRAPQRR
jgi:hypothetical protein